MARPQCPRQVGCAPRCRIFKPAGIPRTELDEVRLQLDELEALRLADLEGRNHEHAAETMGVSRATFGRVLENARRKVAEALTQSKAILIEGGNVEMMNERTFACTQCGNRWNEPRGTGRPAACPKCQHAELHRVNKSGGEGCGKRTRQRRRHGA